MLNYLLHRLAMAAITVWAISIVTFIIIQLPPGDFADAYVAQLAASGTSVSEGQADSLRREYGLNQPYYVQYLKWMGRVLSGDFGMSMEWRRPIYDVIGDRLWLTVVVSLFSLLLTWMIALPIGIYSAVRQYSLGDYVFTVFGFLGLAIPNFLLALVAMYFAFRFLGLQVGGLFSPEFEREPWSIAKAIDLAWHLILPGVILAMAGTAQLIRIMRANLLDELKMPYVTTARAKGLSEWKVIGKYPVRAALNPFASSFGYIFPQIVSGSVIVSLVLGLPTVGPLLLRALISQDLYLAGAIILLLGVLTVVGTFISDLLLMWIDPRIRNATVDG